MKVLTGWFNIVGWPEELLSDNGPSYRSYEFAEWCKERGLKHIFSSVYYPQGNSIVERFHGTIKKGIARSELDLRDAVWWYNVTPHTSTGVSPYQVLFQARPRIEKIDQERKMIRTKLPEKPQVSTQDGTKLCKLKVGERVLVKPPNAKCDTKWNGPFRVEKILAPGTVIVNGTQQNVKRLVSVEKTLLETGVDEEVVNSSTGNYEGEGLVLEPVERVQEPAAQIRDQEAVRDQEPVVQDDVQLPRRGTRVRNPPT